MGQTPSCFVEEQFHLLKLEPDFHLKLTDDKFVSSLLKCEGLGSEGSDFLLSNDEAENIQKGTEHFEVFFFVS